MAHRNRLADFPHRPNRQPSREQAPGKARTAAASSQWLTLLKPHGIRLTYGGAARDDPDVLPHRKLARFTHRPTVRGYAAQIYSITGWTSTPWLCRLRQPTHPLTERLNCLARRLVMLPVPGTLPILIWVRGARHDNLRDVGLDVPLWRRVAVVGVSGSGRTSPAIGTLYAEGVQRFLEAYDDFLSARRSRSHHHGRAPWPRGIDRASAGSAVPPARAAARSAGRG